MNLPLPSSIDTTLPGTDAFDALVDRIAAAAPDTDAEGCFPTDAFQWLTDAGLLAVTLPGEPLDFQRGQTARLLTLLSRIGSANLAVGRVYEGHINALYLIHLYATPDQRQRWYADVREGGICSAFGIRRHRTAFASSRSTRSHTGLVDPKRFVRVLAGYSGH
ncbi:acyl-CoA dehydrogenase family protein [Spirosoma rhododendri]|uniref:acyl-CoA dehydrogenase family protein n=1 Tax=Spirosoma rhododendri TaxID=2728024 RepID=UPI0020C212C8|nr:acyl-CoA dehydrogenase family protein [Spirosoma rhododendri]